MSSRETEELRRRFARRLETYDAAAGIQRLMADRLVVMLARERPERRFPRVLDLGCGTGLLTRRFLETFGCGELFLRDLVPECGAFFRDLPFARFEAADLDELPELPDADAVISGACLQWLKNPGKLFGTVHRALKKGGVFAGSSFSAGNLPEVALCGGAPVISPPAAYWRGLLPENGFRVKAFAGEKVTMEFSSPGEVLRHLRETGVMMPVLAGAGAARRFVRNYEKLRDPSGRFPLTYTPVFWVAEKE